MATIMQATVKLPFITGLDRDVAENTFHFALPIDQDGVTDAFTWLQEAYNGELDGQAKLALRIADIVDRDRCSILFRGIDTITGEQTTVTEEIPMVLDEPTVNGALPLEVALCLSYEALPIAGGIQRRRRGRVYFGPFSAGQNDSQDELPHPAAGLVSALARFGTYLSQQVNPDSDPAWIIWSRAGNNFSPVQRGWVDDEWDTQRRRGVDATSRTFFLPTDF